MLTASGLAFSYGRWHPRKVFRDFHWEVAPGQTTLLLGPNGAGKSTLLKLLSGYTRPTAGAVTLNGRKGRRVLYDGVGWMPQDVHPARGLTVEEQVQYVAWLTGASSRQAMDRARDALLAVDLNDQRATPANELSGGQLRRLGLAQALVRKAPVLLLDEPTAGLDPAQALNFRQLLRSLDAPGGVVISTHQVDDLATEVDRIVVLAEGTILFDGSVATFRALDESSDSRSASLAETFTKLVGGGRH